MTRITLAVLILLLLALTFPNVPNVAATTEDVWVAYGPEDVPTKPMPANFTTDDYLDTTNPYADFVTPQGALDEVDDAEGDNPLYVLVFGDEEERQILRYTYHLHYLDWRGWAKLQIERGDEALVEKFGIDIRILGFLEWDSDDGIEYMTDPDDWDLHDELLADKGHYLRTWYDGLYWSNYVDAIVGITAQATPEEEHGTLGAASGPPLLDEGRIAVLLKWAVYWADDNLVQHEFSHLYYTLDHPEYEERPCCAMAYHFHFRSYILEDGVFWWVFNKVHCAYTYYDWCHYCRWVIQNHRRYPIRVLTIFPSFRAGTLVGTTKPENGSHAYSYDESTPVTVTVTAYPINTNYVFSYWVLDEFTAIHGNPCEVTMNANHTLTACFSYTGDDGGGGGHDCHPWGSNTTA